MPYRRTLRGMSDEEMHVAVATIFHTSQPFRRSREQNSALLLSWLDTLNLDPKSHLFTFVRDDEQDELFLLNKSTAGCDCCEHMRKPAKPMTSATPQIVTYRKDKDRNTDAVTIVTQQPRPTDPIQIHPSLSPSGVRSRSPRAKKTEADKDKPEKPNGCLKDCCSECANICSNILSG